MSDEVSPVEAAQALADIQLRQQQVIDLAIIPVWYWWAVGELSDSALSKQLTTLEQAGYAEIRKGFIGKRPRTSARLTAQGQAAFEQHVAALQQIVVRSGATILPSG